MATQILSGMLPGTPAVQHALKRVQAFSGICAAADLDYGLICSLNATGQAVAGGTNPIGVVERPNPDLEGKVLSGTPTSIIPYGGNSVVVLAESAIASATATLYYRTTADATKTTIGAVAGASGTGLTALPNAKVLRPSYTVDGKICVEIHLS